MTDENYYRVRNLQEDRVKIRLEYVKGGREKTYTSREGNKSMECATKTNTKSYKYPHIKYNNAIRKTNELHSFLDKFCKVRTLICRYINR